MTSVVDLVSLNWSTEEQARRQNTLLASRKKRAAPTATDPREEEKVIGPTKSSLAEPKVTGIAGTSVSSASKKPKLEGEENVASDVSKKVVANLKTAIIKAAKPSALDSILVDFPASAGPQDDFMTRCAHHGLH